MKLLLITKNYFKNYQIIFIKTKIIISMSKYTVLFVLQTYKNKKMKKKL